MKSVKRNADWEQNVEVRRLINDAAAREQPLEILEQEISVFEKAEHAQIHADAGDEPALLRMSIFGFANLTTEPEIHRGGREQKRGEWRIPCAVKNVARDNEQILAKIPAAKTPVERRNDYVENDEGERIEKHGEMFELRCRTQLPVYATHIEADVLDTRCRSSKTG